MRFLEKNKLPHPDVLQMCLTGIWKEEKKLLLKFNINLARLWAELEEQSAAQWKARDGSDVISTSKAEIIKKENGQLIPSWQVYTVQISSVILYQILLLPNGFSLWKA